MWMIKPAIPREITIDLPEVLVESLGIGAHVLAQYLNGLADTTIQDHPSQPPPLSVLCRICERQITPWWFEKHTELCLQEHRAEMDVQLAHESLSEHRASIVKVLDALEAQALRTTRVTDSGQISPLLQAEYKGHVIGPSSAPTSVPSSLPSSGRASPSLTQPKTREPSVSSNQHSGTRGKSFTVRRPLARIVELVLDLCDTAMEISTPTLKESDGQDGGNGEIRTQSPASESRISQVNHWQSPSTGTLELEQGLSLLCDDTQNLCKTKVEAVSRHRQVLEYSERIRVEFDLLVQECIDEALAKASRIAAGELSDASENSSSESEDIDEESQQLPKSPEIPAMRKSIITSAGPQSLAAALQNATENRFEEIPRRKSSTAISVRSNSPMESKTPRSMLGSVACIAIPSRSNTSVLLESDAGAESDSSFQSSLTAASKRAESPSTDLSLVRVASNRGRKRTSLALPSLQPGSRPESPVRLGMPVPISPMRTFKPRVQSGESIISPITSPLQAMNEFTSPILRAHHVHHRRKSSVALGEAYRNGAPLSPRLTAISSNPQPKASQTSIKDFEIIKPISKGAFGSVYLAKKKLTGDYFAIKVLKKGDMVAKNQVTNVKAERAIMMWQGESDFVAKLYWTFSSKDYLYLVMEYLNGGDCSSLIKSLGGLPEDWAKKYLAEVVLGVQHLHSRQIIHRDLKPENLLIDQKGHLKLTDFGLSRMGLVGRQKRIQNSKTNEAPDLSKHNPFRREPSIGSSRSTSFDFHNHQQSPAETPTLTPAISQDFYHSSYFNIAKDGSREASRRTSSHRSDSGNSDALNAMFRRFSLNEDAIAGDLPNRRSPIEEESVSDTESPDTFSIQQMSASQVTESLSLPNQSGMLPPPMALFDPEDNSRRFVGTPDYLAPETINGVVQDEMSDWWSLGCILFESLYGYPPFHASTPDEVFQNILDRKISWPTGEDDSISPEAKDLINKLLTLDPKDRLGSNPDDQYTSGGDQVRAHAWFADIDWTSLREDEASFIPQPTNAEDTEYFDARGATLQNFNAEFEDQTPSPLGTPGADYPDRPHDALSRVRMKVNSIKRGLMPLHIPPHVRDGRLRRPSEPSVPDDFGNFQFKNLPVLEKANKDVLSKLRQEAMQAQSRSNQAAASNPSTASPMSASTPLLEASPVITGPMKRALSIHKSGRPSSPSIVTQTISSPSKQSQPSSPLLVSFSANNHHERRKTSSGSSLLSHQAHTLQPGSFFDIARMGTKASSSVASSPIKAGRLSSIVPGQAIQDDVLMSPLSSEITSPRQRSRTIGNIETDPRRTASLHQKRRSQVFDVSPSSSDTEDQRQKALLRVQRRRQSSKRMSQITLAEGPMFRPLDVLICEDHPVSRLVMERLLEKLRCRTISVHNGLEAMRYAMSEVKFDIIMMEFKLPQTNGADVARMIRETKNANTHTPIVAVTGYLKELQAPHDFDALIEKPPDTNKLTEVMGRLCMWKPAPPGWTPAQLYCLPTSGLRKSSMPADDSPTSTTASGVFSTSHLFSREDSMTTGSGSIPDMDMSGDHVNTRKIIEDWAADRDLDTRLASLTMDEAESKLILPMIPRLAEQHSAPAAMESPARRQSIDKQQKSPDSVTERALTESAEAGDDEDEELGHVQVRSRSPKKRAQATSKLATEMLRTNSQGSVVSGEDATAALDTVISSPQSVFAAHDRFDDPSTTPPSATKYYYDDGDDEEEAFSICKTPDVDMTPRAPQGQLMSRQIDIDNDLDPDPTPKKAI